MRGENATTSTLAHLREARVAADDAKALLHEGKPCSSEPQKLDIETIDSDRLFDTGVAAYLLRSSRSSFDINSLVELYFGSSFLGLQMNSCCSTRLPAARAPCACTH